MNEGKLPPEVPVEILKSPHISKPGNTLLADVFYKAGFIESGGSGTLQIVDKCLEQGLPEPEFVEEYGVFQAILYRNRFAEETLRKRGFNDRQIKAVFFVIEKGKINNKEYSELNNVSKATATRDLKELVEKNIFQRHGTRGLGIFYQLMGSMGSQWAHH